MKKNKALGQDPLAWIKATKDADSKQDSAVPKAKEQETPGVEAEKADKTEKTEKTELKRPVITPVITEEPVNVGEAAVEEPKTRPVIEKPQPIQKTTEPKRPTIHLSPFVSEQGYISTKEGILGDEVVRMPHEAPPRADDIVTKPAPTPTPKPVPPPPPATVDISAPQQKETAQGTSIFFVIAYAFLLLILMFFIYFHLSERMEDMSTRISNMEKALNLYNKGAGGRL